MKSYLTQCSRCRCTTSKKYAREHGGLCKGCVEPRPTHHDKPTRNERVLESGYLAYAVEEGHYDHND